MGWGASQEQRPQAWPPPQAVPSCQACGQHSLTVTISSDSRDVHCQVMMSQSEVEAEDVGREASLREDEDEDLG